MTAREGVNSRSYWPFSIAYAIAGAAALGYSAATADLTSDLWYVPLFAVLVTWVDDWPYRVAARSLWTNSVIVVIAGIVLAPPTTAAFVGGCIMVGTAYCRIEREDFQLSRIVVNAGMFVVVGCAMGALLEVLSPEVRGPSLRLLIAVLVASMVDTWLSHFMATAAVWYRYGMAAAASNRRLARLWIRALPSVLAAGLLASAVLVVGGGWLWFALTQILVIALYPVARARLDVKRAKLVTTVTRALDGRGLVGSTHARMEEVAIGVGDELGLSEVRLQQLRYVVLTYSMTDLFAGEIARPADLPAERGFGAGFSRLIHTGLLLDDLADAEIQAIADTVARYDALVVPVEGTSALSHAAAIAELRSAPIEPRIVDAIERLGSADDVASQRLRRRLAAGYPPGPGARGADE